MQGIAARLVGVELYFEALGEAKQFYAETLGLLVEDEEPGHYTKFGGGAPFLCLERTGSESYPSRDKAVLFFEVTDLQAAIAAIGRDRFVQTESHWAVLHDPEGHNVLLLESGSREPSRISPDVS
jgi:predicted enzyme related to lactoylglutathione lyase